MTSSTCGAFVNAVVNVQDLIELSEKRIASGARQRIADQFPAAVVRMVELFGLWMSDVAKRSASLQGGQE
jgi:hypothetical protein